MNRLLNRHFIRTISIKAPKLPKGIPPHRMAEIEEEERNEFYKHPDYNVENQKWTGIREKWTAMEELLESGEGDEYNKRED